MSTVCFWKETLKRLDSGVNLFPLMHSCSFLNGFCCVQSFLISSDLIDGQTIYIYIFIVTKSPCVYKLIILWGIKIRTRHWFGPRSHAHTNAPMRHVAPQLLPPFISKKWIQLNFHLSELYLCSDNRHHDKAALQESGYRSEITSNTWYRH